MSFCGMATYIIIRMFVILVVSSRRRELNISSAFAENKLTVLDIVIVTTPAILTNYTDRLSEEASMPNRPNTSL